VYLLFFMSVILLEMADSSNLRWYATWGAGQLRITHCR
jgi:hypothetical protein